MGGNSGLQREMLPLPWVRERRSREKVFIKRSDAPRSSPEGAIRAQGAALLVRTLYNYSVLYGVCQLLYRGQFVAVLGILDGIARPTQFFTQFV